MLPHLRTVTRGCCCVDLLEIVERFYSSSKWAVNDYNYLLISFFRQNTRLAGGVLPLQLMTEG